MNDSEEVYWERKKQPEYPMFQELRENKPNWDTAKLVFDVADKYQRFYSGEIIGNKVAEKEQRQKIREKERSSVTSNGKGDPDEQEDEYFNSLRMKLKPSYDSDGTSSPRSDGTCSCDKEKKIVCQLCAVKKRGDSASNSPRNRSNNETVHKKTFSSSNSPRNAGAMGGGKTPSKFKKV